MLILTPWVMCYNRNSKNDYNNNKNDDDDDNNNNNNDDNNNNNNHINSGSGNDDDNNNDNNNDDDDNNNNSNSNIERLILGFVPSPPAPQTVSSTYAQWPGLSRYANHMQHIVCSSCAARRVIGGAKGQFDQV